jgi:hypothetical protein
MGNFLSGDTARLTVFSGRGAGANNTDISNGRLIAPSRTREGHHAR